MCPENHESHDQIVRVGKVLCLPLYSSSDVSFFVPRANINVWASFLKLLNRQDQFIVHQVCKI